MNRKEWLAQVKEEIIEPDLPICDPHHHLWDTPTDRYLLDEILEDTNGGHNIVSTVFVECNSMFRAGGPEALKVIGETEFVQGIAAMSASGKYGNTRVANGIVSHADLTLGADVRQYWKRILLPAIIDSKVLGMPPDGTRIALSETPIQTRRNT